MGNVLNPVPEMVTVVPTEPLTGVNELILGCAVILINPNNEMYNKKYFKIGRILQSNIIVKISCFPIDNGDLL